MTSVGNFPCPLQEFVPHSACSLRPSPLHTTRNITATQTSMQIDVLMLYSEMALEQLGNISGAQMTTIITDAIASTNEAFTNSGIALHFRLVGVEKVRMKIFKDLCVTNANACGRSAIVALAYKKCG